MSEISTRDYVALSSCVYKHGLVPEGYDLVDYWDEAGFYGAAYSRLNTDEIVIAFRGTELDDPFDILNDIAIILDMALDQTKYAYSFYQQVKRIYHNTTISLTGHSLGGVLAQLVAVLIARDEGRKIHTETFNAPGVSEIAQLYWSDFQNFNKFEVVNYYNPHDRIGKSGIHIGAVIEIDPSFLYDKKMAEGGFSKGENPVDYWLKFYFFPNAHFIKFFEEYYNIEENSFKQIESEINDVCDPVSNGQMWSAADNQVNEEKVPTIASYDFTSYATVPALAIDMLKARPEKAIDTAQIKGENSYGNNISISNRKEAFENFNKNVAQLKQQDDKFTFLQKSFYENYDEKYKSLSEDLNRIANSMYNQSDSLMLQMSKNVLNTFSKQDQEDEETGTTVALQGNNGMSNNDFVPQYQPKYDSGQVSLQGRMTLRQTRVNIINNLGVTLSAASNTRWNGQQYVVEVALNAQS
jgi:gas vesicle protein